MSRPARISDAQVLDAAREVFLERGIRATTADVARRAGVAAGSIFKRFPTNFELFRVAMDIDGADPEWLATLGERVGHGEVLDTLTELAKEMVAYFRRVAPLMMMRWSNPDSSACNPAAPHPALQRIRKLTSYFEAEIALGRMRPHDPEILARAFVGSLLNFVFLEVLVPAQEQHAMPADRFVAGLVGLFWAGASPLPNPVVLGKMPSPEIS